MGGEPTWDNAKATSRPPSILSGGGRQCLAPGTTAGRVMRPALELDVRERYECSPMSDHAQSAGVSAGSDTTEMETPSIMPNQTSLFAAESATCEKMGDSKGSHLHPLSTSRKRASLQPADPEKPIVPEATPMLVPISTSILVGNTPAAPASTDTSERSESWAELIARRAGIKPYYAEKGIVIFNSDCREILPQLGRFDLLLTDPPYGISYDSRGGTGLAKRRAYDIPTVFGDDAAFDPSWLLTFAGRQIIWGADHFRFKLPQSGRLLVWNKRVPRADPNALKFADAEMAWDSDGSLTKLFSYVEDGFVRESTDVRSHPTQKPLALMKWCVSLFPAAKTLLDPFCGSGTSLVAAKEMGLTAVGIEREEKYCEIAAKRLSQEVLQYA